MSNLDEIRASSLELAAAERAKAQAKGADLKQHAIIVAMASAVTTQLRLEFGRTRYGEFYREVRDSFLANASVEQLRYMAELHRAAGEERNALDAIFAADYQEWYRAWEAKQ